MPATEKRPLVLSDKILKALKPGAFESGASFLPQGAIDRLITNESILKAIRLSNHGSGSEDNSEDQELAQYILKNAKKVFAISVSLGLPPQALREGMQQVRNHDLSDSDLPTDEACWERKGLLPPESDDEDSSEDSEDDSDDEDSSGTFEDTSDDQNGVWVRALVKNFCGKQWDFLAPVFCLGKFHEDLQSRSVLPFTKTIKDGKRRSGAFGQVFGYQMHPSHLISTSDQDFRCPKYVAVKKIIDDGGDRQKSITSWEREAGILERMNELGQSHIVRLLTAFRRGSSGNEDHYLMLEWADGGNLRNLWEELERPALTADLVKATVEQLVGLAEAISNAHYPAPETSAAREHLNFRHGDLKPENILWFKNEDEKTPRAGIGMLKIGDWGLAKKHHIVTELRSYKTNTRWGTRAYEPPEEAPSQGVKLRVPGSSGKKRSRLYDIWAMGCITLEFLIWLAYGVEELERFNEELRQDNPDFVRFYKIIQTSDNTFIPEVHPVAVQWMDHMAMDSIHFRPGSTALGNLLEIIRTRLLVVTLPERFGTSANMNDFSGASVIDHRVPDGNNTGGLPATNYTNRSEPSRYSSEVDYRQSDATATQKRGIIAPLLQQHSPGIPVIIEPDATRSKTKEVAGPVKRSGLQRARSNEFHNQMLIILGEDEKESYWFTGPPSPPYRPNYDNRAQPSRDVGASRTEDSGMTFVGRGKAAEALQAQPRLAPGLAPRTEQVYCPPASQCHIIQLTFSS